MRHYQAKEDESKQSKELQKRKAVEEEEGAEEVGEKRVKFDLSS